MRLELAVALAWCLASRLAELWWSRRTRRRLLQEGGAEAPADGFRFIALVHTLWLGGLAAEELAIGPSALPSALRWGGLGLFVGSEVLRASCLLTLGWRWNVRVITLPGAAPLHSGPYRWVRHPNYVAVVAGLVALPIALGLPWTATLVLPLKLAALRRRLRIENAALRAAAGAPA